MGTSTDAILFYGYCWDEEDHKLWEEDEDDDDRYKRMGGKGRVKCTVGRHCSASVPMPYVAVTASVTSARRGYPERITSLDVKPTWDADLVAFCQVMQIDVGDMRPAWWLVSDWDV